ncbi:MAG: DUF4249 domain-containing protein [Bacteroidia bacterium]
MQTTMNWRWSGTISFVLSLIILFISNGCQKVVNLDLVEAAPRLVIDGLITDSIGPYRIRLTNSGSYFNQPVLTPVRSAVVVISNNIGTTDTLKEAFPGIYLTSKLRGIPGRTYSLKLSSENKEYTATSTMMSHVDIDSLKITKSPSRGFGLGGNGRNEKRVDIHCVFKDPTEKNFYRIKVYRNDTINIENYRLYDDEYTNGKLTDLQVGRANVGSVVRIELISLDKNTYDYYRTLRDLLRTNPIFGSTPANPNTNLTNGALGYFGAAAVSTRTIVITESLFNSAK